jgi:hypothetical protein
MTPSPPFAPMSLRLTALSVPVAIRKRDERFPMKALGGSQVGSFSPAKDGLS